MSLGIGFSLAEITVEWSVAVMLACRVAMPNSLSLMLPITLPMAALGPPPGKREICTVGINFIQNHLVGKF